MDAELLHQEFAAAKAVIIFSRNTLLKLNQYNYPELSKIVLNEPFLYLPQASLSIELDLSKADIFEHQEDKKIAEHYMKEKEHHGGNVIGILAVNKNYEEEEIQSDQNSILGKKQEDEGEKFFYVVNGNLRIEYIFETKINN